MRRAAVLVVVACLALPAGAAAWRNPANAPVLLNQPIEPYRYDYARGCRHKLTPGIKRLSRWIDRRFPGESWGVLRCERLDRRSWSLHSEARALDWRLDAGVGRERRAARRLIRRLLAPDLNGNAHALARRMGVQEIIFNCRSWFSGPAGMRPYSACEGRRKVDRTTAHRDHIHLGMSWPGAKVRTSFWRSGLERR
jgi:hypothetical protein